MTIAVEKKLELKLIRKSGASVIYLNDRVIWPDNYPAKFDDVVASDFIQLHTNEGETVVDDMAGSGVIPIQAVQLNRNSIAIDVNPEATRLVSEKYHDVQHRFQIHGDLKILTTDSRKIPLPDNSVQLVFKSPPFGIRIDAKHDKYSDNPSDVGNADSYEAWRKAIYPNLCEDFRILEPGRLLMIEIRPRSEDKEEKPLFSWLVEDCEKIGFKFFTHYIEVASPFTKWSSGYKLHRKPFVNHSFLLLFQKPEFGKLW